MDTPMGRPRPGNVPREEPPPDARPRDIPPSPARGDARDRPDTDGGGTVIFEGEHFRLIEVTPTSGGLRPAATRELAR
jgi:hypothetical protein